MYNKSLQKSLNTQQKKLSSLTRDCNLPIITANETITNLLQYELSQEKSDLLKVGLCFLTQTDSIQKFKIFTTFQEIHYSFLNNLKSKETKSQIKAHLLYLANSYFYNYKSSPQILCQHCALQNLRKSKDIEEIISDTFYFLCKLKQKNFLKEIEYDKLYPSGSAPV